MLTLPARYPRLTALIAGTASATGFAPLGLWPVTLIALALLIHLVDSASTRQRSFLLGWLFGVGHFALGLHWIATAFSFQAAMPVWLGWVAVALVSLFLAVFPGLATLAAHLAVRGLGDQHPRRPLVLALSFAAAWIVSEWLRSWLFTGFAWNPLAAILLTNESLTRIIAPASKWIGTYGLSGLVALFGALLAKRSVRARASPEYPSERQQLIVQLTVGGILAAGFGLMYLKGPVSGDEETTTGTRVTIVQPNINQGDKWDLGSRRDNFRRLAQLSAPQEGTPPRLLLWPEAAVPDYLEDGYPIDWYLEDPGAVRARLSQLLGPDDLLLTGAVRLEVNDERSDIAGARNSLFVMNRRGQLGPRYDKAHLVPFGEYLPMRTLLEPLGLSRLVPGAVDFWDGPGPRSLDLGRFGKVGVQICYEIIFSGQVVDRADRPDFIFNPSNDAWFGAWGPPQHLAQARLRAIEEGLPVVRATPTGISAIIDADGRIVDSIPMHQAGRIDARVPVAHAPTLFARYGNMLPLLFAALLAALAVALRRRRR